MRCKHVLVRPWLDPKRPGQGYPPGSDWPPTAAPLPAQSLNQSIVQQLTRAGNCLKRALNTSPIGLKSGTDSISVSRIYKRLYKYPQLKWLGLKWIYFYWYDRQQITYCWTIISNNFQSKSRTSWQWRCVDWPWCAWCRLWRGLFWLAEVPRPALWVSWPCRSGLTHPGRKCSAHHPRSGCYSNPPKTTLILSEILRWKPEVLSRHWYDMTYIERKTWSPRLIIQCIIQTTIQGPCNHENVKQITCFYCIQWPLLSVFAVSTWVSLKRNTMGLFSSPAFIITFFRSSLHSGTP